MNSKLSPDTEIRGQRQNQLEAEIPPTASQLSLEQRKLYEDDQRRKWIESTEASQKASRILADTRFDVDTFNPAAKGRGIATRRPTKVVDEASTGDRRRILNAFYEFGDFTMAYATLQPGLSYFETHGGYLAFRQHMGITFVLGDPVGKHAHHAAMIESFLRTHRRVCFCQISSAVGAILNERGWYVNEIGSDIDLNLATYNFDGPQKSKLRQAAHKVDREGYHIEERLTSAIDREQLDHVSSQWRKVKSLRREARFLVRPYNFGNEPGVRKFFLTNPVGELVAFIVFDPICRDGEVIGYSPSVKRRSDSAPVGAEEAITKRAIEQFQSEGKTTFRLGLMPLYDVRVSQFRDAWPMRTILQCVYRYGDRWLFNFQGHVDFKHRYRGELTKAYVATAHKWGNAYYLVALMRLCNLL